ncbi:MAG: PQQ-binding-like beta-propeller repeat protein [Williamsia sp.]|nr:PQQ-binding-like beta-propeller repeat protein [Williamsia sp.]
MLAVVTVTAAVLVITGRGPSGVKRITGTDGATPGLAWTLDAAKYLGRPFGQFSDPRGGASYRSGEPGLLLARNTLITIAATPTKEFELDDAVMLGIDPETGVVRWKSPARDLEQCSDTPIAGRLYCLASNDNGPRAIVTYDIKSGATARKPVKEFVFGIATSADTLYTVEGSPEENDVRVHSGTFDNVSANWTRGFDIGGGWEDVFTEDLLTVTDGVGLISIGGQVAEFDARSGAQRWLSNDFCSSSARLETGGVVVHSDNQCGSSETITGQSLRDRGGHVLMTTKSTIRQVGGVDNRTGADDPLIIGDAAFDRRTGTRLWTSRDLVSEEQDSQGTLTAVVGDIGYLRDGNLNQTGIDLRNGKRLWRNPTVEYFTPRAAADGVVAGDDGTDLIAFDVRDGHRVWTAPFTAIDPNPETFSKGGAMKRYGDGWIYSSDRRMIGLAPL